MKKENSNNGLNSPTAALAVASTVANSEEGQKAIGQSVNALKYVFIGLGLLAAGRYMNIQFKKVRADRFARENVGNPNLTAAAIIYEAFTRIGFPDSSLLSMLIPSVNISTDESALYNIARQVTNVKVVSEAYSILFDRNLFTDIRKGLDTEELQRFWNIISSPAENENTTQIFPVGSILFCAVKQGITVNMAEEVNENWTVTNELYNTIDFREKIGEVIYQGVNTHQDGSKENYYVVEGWFFSFPPKRQGVVLQHQVTNKEI